jgi:polyisoprenoid-binding protein YceI
MMTESASTALLPTASEHASSAPLAASAGRWQLDPANTTIEFHTKAIFGLANVKGTFAVLSGSGVVGDGGDLSGELVVDATSIDTKNKRRDTHLRGADFFDVSKYPTCTFTTTEVTPSGDGTLKIKGALHIKDQSRTIEIVATPANPSSDRVTLHAEASIDRSRWGMTWKMAGAWLVNRVVVDAQFVRPAR